MSMESDLSFPRRHARSQRFTLGRPRSFTLDPAGARLLFLRSDAGDDPVHHLWRLDLPAGDEHRLVDARTLDVDLADLPPAERARRERAREGAGGIVTYATDHDVEVAAFALGGQAWTVDVADGRTRHVAADGPVFDVRPAPRGGRVAGIVDGALNVAEPEGPLRPLAAAEPGEDGISWGMADFVAAEEMHRSRGYWWSPEGDRLLVCRVDESAVPVWTIADPAHPDRPAVAHRYPAAGTVNPDVTLWEVDAESGARTPVDWDRDAFPYLAEVVWGDDGLPLLLVQTRGQRTTRVLAVEAGGATRILREDTDPAWVELVPGVPAWSAGRLVTVADLPAHGPVGSRALLVDGEAVTPPGLQVRRVLTVADGTAWVTASLGDPTAVHVVAVDLADGATTDLSPEPGVHDAVVRGGTQVVSSSTLDSLGTVRVVRDGGAPVAVAAAPMDPGLDVRVEMLELGERGLRGALLRPAGDGPWPVLLDPYGGPHAQRVVQSLGAFLTPQWFADEGFAVLVVDGRGTPARGPAWDRAVHMDLANPPLADQIDALHAAAAIEPRLDLTRVAIRGWSFGGYLAALACLRRPDVFRAGIVGAPVTDWRLYDTHYTERYLGHPDEAADAYLKSSLVDPEGNLVDAAPLDGPPPELLIIHGLADDNVVAAHSLRLSSALLAAGRGHRFLPLSGVTHMTPQEVVAENLLLLQRDFLRQALGAPRSTDA
jgi:dipeptidyl-peptidase 4